MITVKDDETFSMSRDGVQVGTLQVSLRRDGKVRVAFDFPREIEIWRGEIADRKAQSNNA